MHESGSGEIPCLPATDIEDFFRLLWCKCCQTFVLCAGINSREDRVTRRWGVITEAVIVLKKTEL